MPKCGCGLLLSAASRGQSTDLDHPVGKIGLVCVVRFPTRKAGRE